MRFIARIRTSPLGGPDEVLVEGDNERAVMMRILASPLYEGDRITGVQLERIDSLEEREQEAADYEQYLKEHPEEVMT